ncbi:MAG: hypothetical protein ACRD22_09185 [Terriglobia bacterium]
MTWQELTFIVIVPGLSAYLGSYLKKKGENLATHEDIGKLVDQVKAITQATKEIETKISDAVWKRERKAELQLKAIESVNKLTSELVTKFMRDDKHVPSDEWFSSFSAASSIVKALFDAQTYAKFKELENLIGPGLGSQRSGETFAVYQFIAARDAAVKAMSEQVIG